MPLISQMNKVAEAGRWDHHIHPLVKQAQQQQAGQDHNNFSVEFSSCYENVPSW